MKVVPIESESQELARLGEKRLIYSIERTGGRLEPTAGDTLSVVTDIGKAGKLKVSTYESKGAFSNIPEAFAGKQKASGLIFSSEGKLLEGGAIETGATSVPTGKGYGFIPRPGAEFKPSTWSKEQRVSNMLKSQKGQMYYMKESGKTIVKTQEPIFVDVSSSILRGIQQIGLVSASEAPGLLTGGTQLAVSGVLRTTKRSNQRLGSDLLTVSAMEEAQKERVGVSQIGLLAQEEITEEAFKRPPVVDKFPIQEPISERDFGFTPTQVFQQATAQRLGMVTLSTTALMPRTPLDVSPIIPIIIKPIIPPFPKKKKKDEEEERLFGEKEEKEFFKKTTKRRKRGLPPDLLSVTQSQARYGKATAPKVTEKLFKESSKKLFLRTPTVELMKETKRRRII